MEPLTHFLLGANLGRAGLNRKTALATATLTLAAEAPDLDVLGQVRGSVFGFAHHRGFTHSFLGGFLVASLVVGLMYLLWRVRGRRTRDPNLPPRWGLLLAYAYFASVTHILLDFTNNYGVRPFWPFSGHWYSWDIVFIVEPLLLAFLVLGLITPALFALIREEIGVRSRGPQGRLAATLALIGVVAVWAVRDYEHRRAVAALESRTYQQAEAVRVSAYPNWVNPFRWYGVAETPAFFAMTEVNSWTTEVDPQGDMRIRYKPEESPATLAAKKSYLGRVYLDWAQYPITETEQVSDGQVAYVVRFRDLRYDSPGRGTRTTLGAVVLLDRNLRVVEERFGIRASNARLPQRRPTPPYIASLPLASVVPCVTDRLVNP